MRDSFVKALVKKAETHEDLYLFTGDLGFKLFDNFKSGFPDRFFNAGIAEANMIGLASGLASTGKNVYCYSIIPFLTMRAYEQIRIDVAYNNFNVKLFGVGGGFTYGLEGFTHFGIEDISLMRSVVNMSVVAPADPLEAERMVDLSYDYPSPLYIRLGKGDPAIHTKMPDITIGKGMVLSEGSDITIFATGNLVSDSISVVEVLKNRGLSVTMVNMHTIKPLDKDLVLKCASSHKAIFTVEEHSIIGGLGSAIAEVLAESSYSGIFRRIGIPEKLESYSGSPAHLRMKYGLDVDGISKTILKSINRNEKV